MNNLTTREKVLIAVFLFLMIVFGALLKNKAYLKGQYEKLAKDNTEMQSQLKIYKDDNGKLHGQVETLEADKNTYYTIHKQEMDSLAKILDIKSKNIDGLLKLQTQTAGTFKTKIDTLRRTDTIPGEKVPVLVEYYRVPYKDQWLDFTGILDRGTFTANYKMYDSLTFVSYKKSTGFLGLGPKKSYVDVTSSNPNMTFTGMRNVELKDMRDKKWSIGPYLGYGWNANKWDLSVGISVQYNVIRF